MSKSQLLLFFSIFLLFSSQLVQPVWGSSVKYLFLMLGFTGILSTAILRTSYEQVRRYLPLFTGVLLFIGYLLALAFLNRHRNILNPVVLVFHFVTTGLFIGGVLLGSANSVKFKSSTSLAFSFPFFMLSLFNLGLSLVFIREVQFLTADSTHKRDLGIDYLNPNGVAYVAAVLSASFFVAYIFSRSLFQKFAALGASMLGLGIVIITSARAALIWNVFTLVCILFIASRSKIKVSFFQTLALPAILIIGFLSINDSTFLKSRIDNTVERFESLKTELFEGKAKEHQFNTVAVRKDTYLNWLHQWDDWIFYGYEGYSYYPHNQYLEFLVRFGIFGIPPILFSIWIFLVTLKVIFLPNRTHHKQILNFEILLFFGIFFTSYMYSLTSLSLEMNRGLWLGFGYFLGVKYSTATG